VGPRVGLDAVEERKVFYPCRESNPGCSARSPSLYRLSWAPVKVLLGGLNEGKLGEQLVWFEGTSTKVSRRVDFLSYPVYLKTEIEPVSETQLF
jgi:hypothetical protein